MNDYLCPHNCTNKREDGRCGMDGGYEACEHVKYLAKLKKRKTNIVPPKTPKTNADSIRAMTDEELAELFNHLCCPYSLGGNVVCNAKNKGCYECWLNWLKAPVEEVDNGT